MFIEWTTASLLMAFVVTASQLDEHEETSNISVLEGDDVTLRCGDNSSARRFWKKDEILIVGNSDINGVDRISLVNGSAILRIMKTEVDDEGYYKCIVYTQPRFIHIVKLQVTEILCDAPAQPVGGAYVSEAHGPKYKTGDTITYHCTRGYRLIGQSKRICTGSTKGWDQEEPYCEPEYIGHLMRKLDVIEQRIATVEDKTLKIENKISTIDNNMSSIGNNVSIIDDGMSIMDKRISNMNEKLSHMDTSMSVSNNNMSEMDNRMSAVEKTMSVTNVSLLVMDNRFANMESRLSSVDVNISSLESFDRPLTKIRERLVVCVNHSNAIDQDILSKCLTMELGIKDGLSVSVYTWVIENFNSKVTSTRWSPHYSPVFYHTVPGYKFKLRGDIDSDTEIRMFLYLVPGEYDDQMKWPFSKKYDLTVLKNDGTEVLYKNFSGQQSICKLTRPTTATEFNCFTTGTGWSDVWRNKKHILKDGSTVVKIYIYN